MSLGRLAWSKRGLAYWQNRGLLIGSLSLVTLLMRLVLHCPRNFMGLFSVQTMGRPSLTPPLFSLKTIKYQYLA